MVGETKITFLVSYIMIFGLMVIKKLAKKISDYFHSLVGTPISNRFLLDWHYLFDYKERFDLSFLEQPFSLEEIKLAVFILNADKAPGPNGFTMFFY